MFAWLAAGFTLGLLARWRVALPDGAPELINRYIIFIALPAMILLRVPSLQVDSAALIPVGLAWLAIGSSALIIAMLARRRAWPRDVTGALMMVIPLSNTAYVGIPVIDALTNGAATQYAILYDQLGSFLALTLYGGLVIAVYGSAGAARPVEVIRRIVLFPPFIALVVALVLPGHVMPENLSRVLDLPAATMGPAAMFIVGQQLDLKVPQALRRPLAAGLTVKLLVAPGLVVLASSFVMARGPSTTAAVLQAAMPPMITAALMGMAAGFSRPLIIAAVGIGSIASLLTVPLLVWLSGVMA
ncbi:MAG: AEC family transporter [Pseudomonadota bacterium]